MNKLLSETRPYEFQADRQSVVSEHLAGRKALQLQRYLNWSFELN